MCSDNLSLAFCVLFLFFRRSKDCSKGIVILNSLTRMCHKRLRQRTISTFLFFHRKKSFWQTYILVKEAPCFFFLMKQFFNFPCNCYKRKCCDVLDFCLADTCLHTGTSVWKVEIATQQSDVHARFVQPRLYLGIDQTYIRKQCYKCQVVPPFSQVVFSYIQQGEQQHHYQPPSATTIMFLLNILPNDYYQLCPAGSLNRCTSKVGDVHGPTQVSR